MTTSITGQVRSMRIIGLLVPLVLLSACSLLSEPFRRDHNKPQPLPETVELIELPPVATHRFTIEPASDDVVGLIQTTIASAEDTLPDIARRFDLGYEEIVRANPGVDPWLPGAGREIILPTRFVLPNAPREGIVINVPAMRLFYYPARKKNEMVTVITYPIGVGRVGWATPEGTTTVVKRTLDPTWRVPPSIRKEHLEMGEELPAVVPPGPDNPLGRHSFTLGWPSYLIHGTNKAYGVGMRSSHGCIRLYPEDIEQLFETVPMGTKVRVVNQPLLFGRSGDDVQVQALGALEDDQRDWAKNGRKLMEKAVPDRVRKQLKEDAVEIDWQRAEALAVDAHGVPVSVLTLDASLDTELQTARFVKNAVPEGSNWNGVIEVDEEKFQELLSDREAPETVDTADAGGTTR